MRFQLNLPVRYATMDDIGWGRILNISCAGALFTTERALQPNAEVELCVKWPVLLLNSVHLNLIAAGVIVRVEPGMAAMRIQRYEFRTCSPSFLLELHEQKLSGVAFGFQVQVANQAVQRVGV